MNVNIREAEPSEICRRPAVAALAIGYFCGKEAAKVIPAACLILVAPTFLCSFLSLVIAALPVSGWAPSRGVLQAREAGHSSRSPSPGEGNSFRLRHSQVGIR